MGLLNKVFFKIGLYSATNPCTACFLALMTTIVCSLGFINYRVTVSHSTIVTSNFSEQPPRTMGPAFISRKHRANLFQ